MTAGMAEITVPDYGALLLDGLELNTPAQVNRSSWTGRRKVIGLPGTERWTGQARIDLLTTENEERPWRAFLFGMGGPENWFRWPLPCANHIGPKPVVAAGAGNGYTLPLESMQPNARILRVGQYLTVPLPSGHFRAVCLLADLVTNGAGEAMAQNRPALNETPTEGVTVETVKPFIPMAPTEGLLGFSSSDGVSGAAFDVEEAL